MAGLGAIGLSAAAGGIAALGAGLLYSVTQAAEAQDGQAQLQAVLASTGGVAGVTAEQANALASAFQNTTKFSDDATLAGENMLLTFTNIGANVFPQATEAMLNLAEKMKTGPEQSAVMLGKALNDPVNGLSALTRVGVTFTEEQKTQVQAMQEVGNMAGAQAIILAELEREFGGVAEAAGGTFTGKLTILGNKFSDVGERIGGQLLPVLERVADKFLAGLESATVQAAIEGVIIFVGDAITVFETWAGTLNETVEPAMLIINDSIARISEALGLNTSNVSASDVALAILKGTLDAVTIGIQAGAIAIKLLADGMQQGRANFETIRGAAESVGGAIRGMASGASSAINSLISAWNRLADAAVRAWNRIPKALRPGSPTPFETALLDIAGATDEVGSSMSRAFAGGGSGVGGRGLAMAGVGAGPGGGGAIVVHYSPVISTASQIEVERNLIPLILDGLRKRGVAVG